MALLTDLPVELFSEILSYLTHIQDLSSLSGCSRALCWWTSDQLFAFAFQQQSKTLRPQLVFKTLVFHAIIYDSQHIIQGSPVTNSGLN